MMLRDFRALSWVKKLGMDSKAATSDLQVNLVEETTPLSDSYVRNQPTLKTFQGGSSCKSRCVVFLTAIVPPICH